MENSSLRAVAVDPLLQEEQIKGINSCTNTAIAVAESSSSSVAVRVEGPPIQVSQEETNHSNHPNPQNLLKGESSGGNANTATPGEMKDPNLYGSEEDKRSLKIECSATTISLISNKAPDEEKKTSFEPNGSTGSSITAQSVNGLGTTINVADTTTTAAVAATDNVGDGTPNVTNNNGAKASSSIAPQRPSPDRSDTSRPKKTRSRLRKEIADFHPDNVQTAKNGQHCKIHTPTLDELQKTTFTNYIRNVVFPAVSVYELNPKLTPAQKEEYLTNHTVELSEGIAKIRLPDGFCPDAPYGDDRTGRGEAWQKGTDLGDRVFSSPIQQHIMGMAGVYEYTHTDLPSCTLAEFRERADQYRKEQVGSADLQFKQRDGGGDTKKEEDVVEGGQQDSNSQQQQDDPEPEGDSENSSTDVTGELTDAQIDQLERQFWKRLSPTMPPAVYGADEPGSFFGEDSATGWSLAQLDSCLHVLPDIPGVTSPYLYAGMWATVFCAHAEDMNLLSINYLHAGQPKIWYAVAEPDAARFISLAEHHYVHQLKKCREFLRHKRCMLSPAILKKAGIRYQTAIQYPGDAIVTFPGGYHFGFNAGFNIAEATNFGVPEWLPFGRRANVCLCRPDSVRIDMIRLTNLLQRYRKDIKRNRRLTYLQWRQRQERKHTNNSQLFNPHHPPQRTFVVETPDEIVKVITYSNKKKKKNQQSNKKLSEQQRKNEFWIEVTRPASSENGNSNSKRARKKMEEVWHLAKPLGRKRLEAQTRVLCLVPAPSKSIPLVKLAAVGRDVDGDISSGEEEPVEDEEICFAGTVVQVADGHVKIHFDSLPKHEDVWIPEASPKIFLDGGQWQEVDETVPKLHYWQEMDSKKRARAS